MFHRLRVYKTNMKQNKTSQINVLVLQHVCLAIILFGWITVIELSTRYAKIKSSNYRNELPQHMANILITPKTVYTPYEGLNLANQKNRKLEVYGRKLEESHSSWYCYFYEYTRKENMIVQIMFSSLNTCRCDQNQNRLFWNHNPRRHTKTTWWNSPRPYSRCPSYPQSGI